MDTMITKTQDDAKQLSDALKAAVFPAQDKAWGDHWLKQFHAGHVLAIQLLDAISNGDDIDHIVASWSEAARMEDDTIVLPTRTGRSDETRRFSWKWLHDAHGE